MDWNRKSTIRTWRLYHSVMAHWCECVYCIIFRFSEDRFC